MCNWSRWWYSSQCWRDTGVVAPKTDNFVISNSYPVWVKERLDKFLQEHTRVAWYKHLKGCGDHCQSQKNSLKNFLWLISLPGVLHVDKVRVVFALLVVGERGVVADPIVSHLDSEVEKKTLNRMKKSRQNKCKILWYVRSGIYVLGFTAESESAYCLQIIVNQSTVHFSSLLRCAHSVLCAFYRYKHQIWFFYEISKVLL